ncbi:hypothetical protein [Actinoplanes sp. URMC 104]|uniref:hypothetical protein n=1 Tax=Actinoplanes sp. URMC 104 TaxID=3423409 RepID=UPI003F19B2E9
MNTYVERFRDADRRYENIRCRWNALPTAEARQASGLRQTLDSTHDKRQSAAAALLHDAACRHTIEQKSGVYLLLDATGRWRIDPVTFDGAPLLGYDNGALNEACEHDGNDPDGECDVLTQAADTVELPTAGELTALMLSYLCQHDELTNLDLDELSDQELDKLTAHLKAHRRPPDS